MSIQKAKPHQVVVEKFRRNSVKAVKPALEATVVTVHVLNVVHVTHAPLLAGVEHNVVEVRGTGVGPS